MDALRVILPPRDMERSAEVLIQSAERIFDLVVVACHEDECSSYSMDWLLAADTVVACSTDDLEAALASSEHAEAARCEKETAIVCILDAIAPENASDDANGGRRVYSLGGPAGRRNWQVLLAELSQTRSDASDGEHGLPTHGRSRTAEVGS